MRLVSDRAEIRVWMLLCHFVGLKFRPEVPSYTKDTHTPSLASPVCLYLCRTVSLSLSLPLERAKISQKEALDLQSCLREIRSVGMAACRFESVREQLLLVFNVTPAAVIVTCAGSNTRSTSTRGSCVRNG